MTRKPKKTGQKTRKDDAHKGIQVPFRVEDYRLVHAIESYGERIRHHRNMTIVLLLEEVLTQKGLWPPKEAATTEAGSSG